MERERPKPGGARLAAAFFYTPWLFMFTLVLVIAVSGIITFEVSVGSVVGFLVIFAGTGIAITYAGLFFVGLPVCLLLRRFGLLKLHIILLSGILSGVLLGLTFITPPLAPVPANSYQPVLQQLAPVTFCTTMTAFIFWWLGIRQPRKRQQ